MISPLRKSKLLTAFALRAESGAAFVAALETARDEMSNVSWWSLDGYCVALSKAVSLQLRGRRVVVTAIGMTKARREIVFLVRCGWRQDTITAQFDNLTTD